jgi:hypothetical protein
MDAELNPAQRLHALGQSLWLDSINRFMLRTGTLARYVRDLAVTGLTSIPTILGHAMAAGSDYDRSLALCRARTRTLALSWRFLGSLRCPRVLVDQAADDLSALDPGGHIYRLAGLVQRRSLLPRLMGPMHVVVPRVLAQDLQEVAFTVDQQVVEALAP